MVSIQPTVSNRRAPDRPRLLRTGSRGRPRKLYQTVRESDLYEGNIPTDNEIITDQLEDDIFREGTVDPEDTFAGVAEVSIKEAMSSKEKEEWEEPILSEVESMIKNNTWEIVRQPYNQKTVGCRIVLTNKYGPDGSIAKIEKRE